LLDARAEELHALLDRLTGRAQLNVKASYDEDAVLREVVASQPEVARARERVRALGNAAYYENIRLGELVAGTLAARQADDAERIHARLASVAAEAVPEPVDPGGLLVLKTAYLVARQQLDRFDAELESLAASEAPAILFESFGPLPPTAFVTLRQEG
jgi:Gas vesicle synthesis protein GvpL/GvpF